MGKGVAITYMEEVLVHEEYSTDVTRHMEPISYGKLYINLFVGFAICFV
jgi:hypothetical protein